MLSELDAPVSLAGRRSTPVGVAESPVMKKLSDQMLDVTPVYAKIVRKSIVCGPVRVTGTFWLTETTKSP